ncbi:MAG: hypothetical protein ABIH24_06880, partial [Verrucomicrobiota bacterium]
MNFAALCENQINPNQRVQAIALRAQPDPHRSAGEKQKNDKKEIDPPSIGRVIYAKKGGNIMPTVMEKESAHKLIDR